MNDMMMMCLYDSDAYAVPETQTSLEHGVYVGDVGELTTDSVSAPLSLQLGATCNRYTLFCPFYKYLYINLMLPRARDTWNVTKSFRPQPQQILDLGLCSHNKNVELFILTLSIRTLNKLLANWCGNSSSSSPKVTTTTSENDLTIKEKV